jgi:hypothetical protein
MKNANKLAIRIDDLDVAGPELSDEELRGTHGGLCMGQGDSTCYDNGAGGGVDWDSWPEPSCGH